MGDWSECWQVGRTMGLNMSPDGSRRQKWGLQIGKRIEIQKAELESLSNLVTSRNTITIEGT